MSPVPSTNPSDNREVFKVSDDVISIIRELIQLSLLTGTNIVDHLRAIQLERSEIGSLLLTLAPEYVEAYNDMITKLNEQALAHQAEMQKTPAIED